MSYIDIESPTAILKLSTTVNGKGVLIDLMDIIGEVNSILIDQEQAKQIINFLNNVYEKPSESAKE